MTTPTFEDACRSCDAANAHGINFVASFGALAVVCKDIGSEAVASKAKDLLRIILCSAPMCCNASRIKAVRGVAICVLESGPAAAVLLATGLIKGSSIYAHKYCSFTSSLALRTATLTSCQLRRARALLAPQVGRVTRLCRVSSLFALHLTFLQLPPPCRVAHAPGLREICEICVLRRRSHAQLASLRMRPGAVFCPTSISAVRRPLTLQQLVSQQLKWAVEITRMGSSRTVRSPLDTSEPFQHALS